MKTLFAVLFTIGIVGMTVPAHSQSKTDCRDSDRAKQVRLCTQVIANAGNDTSKKVVGFLYRCQAHDMLGNYELAVEDCKESLKYGDDASTHNSLAIIYQNMKRYSDAIAESTKAIRGNPERGNYYNTRANGNCAAKNFQAAYEDRLAALNKGHFSAVGLQKALKKRGYYDGVVDGDFGPTSRVSLQNWTNAGCP